MHAQTGAAKNTELRNQACNVSNPAAVLRSAAVGQSLRTAAVISTNGAVPPQIDCRSMRNDTDFWCPR